MKICLIAPIDNLEMSEAGHMHMALTPFVLKNEAYRNFYASQTKFKILDNGAYEASLQNMQDILKAAELIKANEIVLPDIVGKSKETIISTSNALAAIKQAGLLGTYKLMAVPQGSTEDEWWQCFNALNENGSIDTIGLSKLSCPTAFSASITTARLKITYTMKQQKLVKKNKEYHLLGGSYEILKEVAEHPSFIRSIDSSAPFEFGKRRILLSSTKEELSKKADIETALRPYNLATVKININKLMHESGE